MRLEDIKDGVLIIGKSIEYLRNNGRNEAFAQDVQSVMVVKKEMGSAFVMYKVNGEDFEFNHSKGWAAYPDNLIATCDMYEEALKPIQFKNRFQLINGD